MPRYVLGPQFGVVVTGVPTPPPSDPGQPSDPSTSTPPPWADYSAEVVSVDLQTLNLKFTKPAGLADGTVLKKPLEVHTILVPVGTAGMPTTADDWLANQLGLPIAVTPVAFPDPVPDDGAPIAATVPSDKVTKFGDQLGVTVFGLED